MKISVRERSFVIFHMSEAPLSANVVAVNGAKVTSGSFVEGDDASHPGPGLYSLSGFCDRMALLLGSHPANFLTQGFPDITVFEHKICSWLELVFVSLTVRDSVFAVLRCHCESPLD